MFKRRQIILCILLGVIYLAIWGLREYHGEGLYGYLRFAPPMPPDVLSLIDSTILAFVVSYISLLLNWVSYSWFAFLLFKPVSGGAVRFVIYTLFLLICIDITLILLSFKYILFFLLGFPYHVYFLLYFLKTRKLLTTEEQKG